MNYNAVIKKTKYLNKTELDSIIKLKQQSWGYDYHSQMTWISQNICDDDLHVLFYEQERLIAYCDAVNVDVCIDGKNLSSLGIGNVCVDTQHRHQCVGKMLLKEVNAYLQEKNRCGFLLCKDDLVGFYRQVNWIKITPQNIVIEDKFFICNIMFFNVNSLILDSKIYKIEFSRLF